MAIGFLLGISPKMLVYSTLVLKFSPILLIQQPNFWKKYRIFLMNEFASNLKESFFKCFSKES